ncbi:outer membrane protein with beta-barrel domain [Pontibacter ummariensis]|uniref:Outer membrane protein beta-barrel domain-containing protein n=1 Tax=Pontibacter ummariensis TaxID=1610492 RepID=A0A239IQ99_9BACT|nr:outer membrane beta-barrel protein [Pontibacter ummariensis]PRY09742.1 outer membrane protein with beta-barrel domain [Pontibacter ummariensis]SNS94604.1 Outer membrane protein beta-barrel domain-containing protein [Pontibacter ummariensis]
MKKLLILLCLVAIVTGTQAQTTQGTIVATGALGYTTSKDKDPNSTERTFRYNLSPQLGYLVTDNLEAGLTGTFDKYHYRFENSIDSQEKEHFKRKATEKATGAYLKKYIFLTENLAFSGTGDITYQHFTETTVQDREQDGSRHTLYNSTYERELFIVAVRPGLSFFLSNKISLNTTYGTLSYTVLAIEQETWQQDLLNEYEDRTKAFTLNLTSSSFFLGLSYYFH